MAINYEKLLALKIPDAEHTYTDKDTMLYALGVGLGHDPLDLKQLDFVYEKNLKALSTFAAVLGYPGFWVRDLDTGIDWLKIVNGEQGVVLHQPVKPAGTVIGRTRIVEVIDKGAGKGALAYTERKVTDKASGALIATVTQTTFCRADGDQFERAALAQITQRDAGCLGAGAAAERRFLFWALAELPAPFEQFVRVELPALVDAE